ncbi:hypothetical protein CcrBL47_gp155c [Caulobacter phage BL47]|nr:hypothetical protein CcrBL47_gp155c [Caulobacter phage BL47]
MALYLVRAINPDEQTEAFLVNAQDLIELFDILDEDRDPSGLEFAKLPSGGLRWSTRRLTPEEQQDEDFEGLPILATPSEGWCYLDTPYNEEPWRPRLVWQSMEAALEKQRGKRNAAMA